MSPALRLTRIDTASDLDGLEAVAIAIGEGDLGSLGHVGILHRQTRSAVRFLHLAWHYRLEHNDPPRDFIWVGLGVRAELAAQAAARCRRIARKMRDGRVPYAPRFRDTLFASDGSLLLGKDENGLTCATFVLAVFSSVGLPLVSTETWPRRSSDARFREFVINGLRSTAKRYQRKAEAFERLPDQQSSAAKWRNEATAALKQIDAVQAEPLSTAFLPEEVAAASSRPDVPLSFGEARAVADEMLQQLGLRAGTHSD